MGRCRSHKYTLKADYTYLQQGRAAETRNLHFCAGYANAASTDTDSKHEIVRCWAEIKMRDEAPIRRGMSYNTKL